MNNVDWRPGLQVDHICPNYECKAVFHGVVLVSTHRTVSLIPGSGYMMYLSLTMVTASDLVITESLIISMSWPRDNTDYRGLDREGMTRPFSASTSHYSY